MQGRACGDTLWGLSQDKATLAPEYEKPNPEFYENTPLCPPFTLHLLQAYNTYEYNDRV
jgi:hypothetical protein